MHGVGVGVGRQVSSRRLPATSLVYDARTRQVVSYVNNARSLATAPPAAAPAAAAEAAAAAAACYIAGHRGTTHRDAAGLGCSCIQRPLSLRIIVNTIGLR